MYSLENKILGSLVLQVKSVEIKILKILQKIVMKKYLI